MHLYVYITIVFECARVFAMFLYCFLTVDFLSAPFIEFITLYYIPV